MLHIPRNYQFLSTPSARRATEQYDAIVHRLDISIHALREEGDLALSALCVWVDNFYPRPPRGGRPFGCAVNIHSVLFLSTPSARRATCSFPFYVCPTAISIHALREEGDQCGDGFKVVSLISIHALREEGDHGQGRSYSSAEQISIHALREEGDAIGKVPDLTDKLFLSTPSARRATVFGRYKFAWTAISIHALREEGDTMSPLYQLTVRYFYPRPPRGGRRI